MDNKLQDTIKKLLAMAEHTGSNENEAAIALSKAQALLFKHNLTMADIKRDTQDTTPAGIGKIDIQESQGYSWKSSLINVIANANLCKVIGGSKELHIFGTYDNVKSVLEMYYWICPQLSMMAEREYRAYKNDEGSECGRTWKSAFYYGAIATIRSKLQTPFNEFASGPGTAIVVSNDSLVKDAVKRVYPYIRHTTRRVSRGSDGYSSGRTAGNGIRLSPQRKLAGSLLLR